VSPSGVLVVCGVVQETAVQGADKAIAEVTQCRVVGVTGSSSVVVEGPGAW
jgi:hypothetical protein